MWGPVLALVGTLVGSGLLYLTWRQKKAADDVAFQREEEAKIVALMVDDFKSTREEVGSFNARNKEMWNNLQDIQRAHFDCERRCALLDRKVHDLEGEVADLKRQIARGQVP